MSRHQLRRRRVFRLILAIATLASLSTSRPAAAQEAPPVEPSQPAKTQIRPLVYAGYTFSSIVRHGATATISLTRVPSDRKERVGNGMHMTFTAGGNGFVVGGGWARCALSSLPGCLEIRGIVGRTRTASDDLEAQEIYLGAEGGLTFLWLRLSTGVAFPARESGVKHPMFVGSIGFVVPIWGLGRN